MQKDYIEQDFSKFFTEYIKNIQRQYSQRAKSILTSVVFLHIQLYQYKVHRKHFVYPHHKHLKNQ